MKRPPRKKTAAVAKASTASHEDALFARVVDIIEAARGHVARSVNTAMVQAYWLIGREIVEVEQHGEKRAGYGDEIIDRLAKRLAARVGQGFGARLRDRGGARELVQPRARAADRVAPVRAPRQEPRQGQGPGACPARTPARRAIRCPQGSVRARVPRAW
ncbi:MAG: DUF1016 N-terminal domain-containing protein [Deltaproteobacteria bacterium]|nr:DUF1016 N-terminal domain-containing protein [Deltaproteobacteria bacterium]